MRWINEDCVDCMVLNSTYDPSIHGHLDNMGSLSQKVFDISQPSKHIIEKFLLSPVLAYDGRGELQLLILVPNSPRNTLRAKPSIKILQDA